MKKPLSNVAESVRTRLLNLRAKTRDDYNELLVRLSPARIDQSLAVQQNYLEVSYLKRREMRPNKRRTQ
jgi:hypothetical protein